MTALRFLRTALAIALVATVSGVPAAVGAALASDCCTERCDGGLGSESCPPNCSSGACAKVFPSAVPLARDAELDAALRSQYVTPAFTDPVLPLVASGVFHPPRR